MDRFRSRYGECLMLSGRLREARTALEAAHTALVAKVGAEHDWTRDARTWLDEAMTGGRR
jgi:hypothetical protein